jgi:hypothetical protein
MNEFIIKNGLISKGAATFSGSITSTGNITSPQLVGTASYATQATSASIATQASTSTNATSASFATIATSASYTVTSSYVLPLSQSVLITGSLVANNTLFVTESRVGINTSANAGYVFDVTGNTRTTGIHHWNQNAGVVARIIGGNDIFTVASNDTFGISPAELYLTNTRLFLQAPRIYGVSTQAGTNYNFLATAGGNATGLLKVFSIGGTVGAQAGGSLRMLNMEATHSVQNTNNTFTGIYYNPNMTAVYTASFTSSIHNAIHVVTGDTLLGTTSGRVAIGKMSPSASLDVTGSVIITGSLNVSGSLVANNTLYVTGSMVGINTSANAGYHLDVAGTIRSSGFIYATANMYMDGSVGKLRSNWGALQLEGASSVQINNPALYGNQTNFAFANTTFIPNIGTNSNFVLRGNNSTAGFTNGGSSGTSIGNVCLSNINLQTAIGNVTLNHFVVQNQISSSAGTTLQRGFYYNPSISSSVNLTHRAIETTSGDVIIGGNAAVQITGSLTISGSIQLNGSDIATAWTSYTPTWTSNGGSQPALNNGTITGAYKIIGKTCFVRVKLNPGSTTTFGAGALLFGLPVNAASPDGIQFPCSIMDQGNAWYQATVNGTYSGFTDKSAIIVQSAGGGNSSEAVTGMVPITFGASDSIQFNGSYEIA